MDIFLRVEISARELESKLLLAVVAAGKGHRVLVAGDRPTLLRALLFRRRRPGVVHLNSLTPGNAIVRFQRIFRYAGCGVSSMDEEAGIFWKSYDQFARIRFGNGTLALADRVFCWGDSDQKSLRAMFIDHHDKFIVTGSPRVDLWHPRFDSLYADEGAPPAQPFILLASSIGGPLFWQHLHERLAQVRANGDVDRSAEREESIVKGYVEGAMLLPHYLQMIRLLSEEMSGFEVVVKPHPKENPAAWAGVLAGLSRVRLSQGEPISKLVRQSSAVITTASTTALEAAVAGIPLLTFQPIPTETRDSELSNNVGITVSSPEDVLANLKIILDANPDRLISQRKLELAHNFKKKIFHLEGQLAAERMLGIWEDLSDSDAGHKIGVSRQQLTARDYLYWVTFAFLPRVVGKIRYRGTSQARVVGINQQKHPQLDRAHVQRVVSALENLLGLRGKVSIKFVGKKSLVVLPLSGDPDR